MMDIQRISFMIQRLSGRAKDWAAAIWKQGGAETQNYAALLREFSAVFDHPDLGQSSGRWLHRLQQGTESAADYSIRFRILPAISG